MKSKGIIKRISALIMAVVITISALPITQVTAATGDVKTITFTPTYDEDGVLLKYNSGALVNGHYAGGEGDNINRISVDGDTAYCIQPGVTLNSGDKLKESSSDAWKALSDSKRKAVGLALLYGYQGNKKNIDGSDDEKWAATQAIVWEFVAGCRNTSGKYKRTEKTVYSLYIGSNYSNEGIEKAYDQIVDLLKEHNTIPSFMSEDKEEVLKDMKFKDGKYTVTLTDENKVLSDYTVTCSNDRISISTSGNKLTISSTEAFEDSVRIKAVKNSVPTVVSGTINESEENTYDSLGRIQTTTDEENIVREYGYDQFSRVISTTTTIPNKTPESTIDTYDLNGRVVEKVDAVGRKTTYVYDNMGRVISETISYGDESRTTTTTYGYVDNFYVVTGTGTNKRIPTVSVVTVKNSNDKIISETYTDPYGQIVRKETNGICVDYTYDKQGNVFTTYTRGVGTTNVTNAKLVLTVYDKNGKLTDTIQNPVYRNGAFTVDATNSLLTSNVYDADGNLIKETDAKGNITTYEYDEEGNLTKISLDDDTGIANDTLYAYDIQNKDASGNIVSTKDKRTNALGYTSETVYNGAGQTLSITDQTSTGYVTTSYQYDNNGNLTKETKPNGNYITYFYNEKNMRISRYEYNSNSVWKKLTSYIYNADDLLEKTIDYNVTNYIPTAYRYTIYEYDEFKRKIGYSEINSSTQPTENQISENKLVYKYDIEDRLIEIRYPNSTNDELKGIKFEYNDYNWLIKINGIIDNDGIEVDRNIREYEYYNDSKVKTIKEYRGFLENSTEYINKSYEYDIFDRTTKMSYADSNNLNTVLEQYTYSYDKNSNITSETIINNYPTNQSEKVNEIRKYTYDSLNRMVTSKITDNLAKTESNATYTYDKVGNCTQIVKDGVTTSNTYNKSNQLTQQDIMDNGTRVSLSFFSYDSNGNKTLEQTMVSPPTIVDTIQYEYDTNDQLIKVTDRDGTTSGTIEHTQENIYNGDGQRISKSDDGVVTYYYYQDGVLLYTTNSNGDKTSQNIVGPDNNIIATVRYEEGQSAYFYNKDIRTSVTNVIDNTGEGVVSYKYDNYGTTSVYGNTDFYNEICYTSSVYDKLTSLYYMNARYYNPSDAVFITQDNYRGEKDEYTTWNLYAYCAGNPIVYVDPSGHAIDTIFDIGSIAYSAFTLVTNPTLGNLGYLAWDIGAAIVPGVPGSYAAKGVKAVSKVSKVRKVTKVTKVTKVNIKVANSVSDFSKNVLSVGKYSVLKKGLKGTKGIEVHHVIEKRFIKGFKEGVTKGNMLSIPLEKKFHKTITKRWRKAVPYGKSGANITKSKMISYCEQVYSDMPQLKNEAINYVNKYWR